VLHNRVSIQEYKKCEGDILAVSEMADDIQDALLEYQVGSEKLRTAVVTEIGFDRQPNNGDVRPELQADCE
jgi:hypothetical protein